MELSDATIKAAFEGTRKGSSSFSMQRNSRTFSFATMFIPGSFAVELQTLYKFCRLVDDIADELADKTLARELLLLVKRDLKRGSSSSSHIDDFIQMSRIRKINLRIAGELIDAVSAEIDGANVGDESHLLRYCYRVAGTVAVMICQLLSIDSFEARCFAIDMAIAMQLTNIARDVAEDFSNGRIYIPDSWSGHRSVVDALQGNSETDSGGQATDALARHVLHLLKLAGQFYRSSDRGIGSLPPSVRPGIMLAARCYEKIGLRIREQIESGSWNPRMRVSIGPAAKLLVLRDVLCQLAFTHRQFECDSHIHDARLHSSLIEMPNFELAFI